MYKKLTQEEKHLLNEWGYPCEDFEQIERAMLKSKTKYRLISLKENGNEESKNITREEAIGILGKRDYLSGIARSAFHWTAYRENQAQTYAVQFDSSALFKN